MPRYRIDTDTLIAACLEKEPYATLSLFDMRAIVNLAANTQGRYLFCDTSPAALERVLSVCRSLYTAPTNISVALKTVLTDAGAYGHDEIFRLCAIFFFHKIMKKIKVFKLNYVI